MSRIEVQKKESNYKADLFSSNSPKPPREKADRYYILDRDANKFSFFLQDLLFEGFPIEKAYKIMMKRLKKRDWLDL